MRALHPWSGRQDVARLRGAGGVSGFSTDHAPGTVVTGGESGDSFCYLQVCHHHEIK